MSILIIAEHDNASVKPATLPAITAARKIGGEIHLLVAGSNATGATQAAAHIEGVAKVIVADAPHLERPTAESIAAVTLAAVKKGSYTHVLAAATGFGKNFLPRVAAKLDVAQASDVTAVEAPDTFLRPIYAGSALATMQLEDPIKVVSVRPTAFEPASASGGQAAIEALGDVPDGGRSRVVKQELTKLARPELGGARIVVSGGRGLGSGENFKLLEALADKLNAAIGASRAAVDAGYVPNDYQVGQTGKVVAPDLYIAVGISGAIQHLAGMKDSKVIVAINKDSGAPIFQVADYGLVGDLFQVVPELTAELGRGGA
jgi:electron transfer flavoprotein alpha subunit